MPYRLGVDLGTTFTAAAVTDGSEPTLLGLGNRALQIPSVVFLKPDGEFLVGEMAERRGLSEPDRLAREFKRRIGDHVPIMVAGAPFSPQALTAQLLRWVVHAATERMGEPPSEVVLTHPANWGPFRLELFDQVAVMAGLTSARHCAEPEAAAAQYAAQSRVEPGDRVAVYDLGGGTFDACVLEKTGSGFRVLGTPEGVEHLGGVDFDEAVFRHILTTLNHTDLDPDDADVTSGLARLRRDCVEAKEALSTDVDTLVSVTLPGLTTTVRVTRAEFETMIRPALTETTAAMARALRSAQVEPGQLRSILLVGGSSRIPLVGDMLHREFSVPTALDTHPKHDVALGSVRIRRGATDIATPLSPGNSERLAPPETGPFDTAVHAPPEAAAAEAPPSVQLPRAVRRSAGAPRGVGWETGDVAPPAEAEVAAAAAWPVVGPEPLPAATPAGSGSGEDRTSRPAGDEARDDGPAGAPTPAAARSGAPLSGRLVRVLAVVLAAVVLGAGAGVLITQWDGGDPPGPGARTGGGAPLLVEDFRTRTRGWDEQEGRYANDKYRIDLEQSGGTTSSPRNASILYPTAPNSIRIDVDARSLDALDKVSGFGVICHLNEDTDDRYQFTVGEGENTVRITKFASGRARFLAVETLTELDATGVNKISAECANLGDGQQSEVHLVFTLNGQLVAEVTDDDRPLLDGTVGVRAFSRQSGIRAEFDNFVVTPV